MNAIELPKYVKCSCGCEEFIETKEGDVVKLREDDEEIVSEYQEYMEQVKYTYRCKDCGNEDF